MKKDVERLSKPGEPGSKTSKPRFLTGGNTSSQTHMDDPFSEVLKPPPFKNCVSLNKLGDAVMVHPRGTLIVSSTPSHHGVMNSEEHTKTDRASHAHDLWTPCASEAAEDTSHKDEEPCSEDEENTLLNSQCKGGGNDSATPYGESPPKSPDHQLSTQGCNTKEGMTTHA
jgi:hypothetical protein